MLAALHKYMSQSRDVAQVRRIEIWSFSLLAVVPWACRINYEMCKALLTPNCNILLLAVHRIECTKQKMRRNKYNRQKKVVLHVFCSILFDRNSHLLVFSFCTLQHLKCPLYKDERIFPLLFMILPLFALSCVLSLLNLSLRKCQKFQFWRIFPAHLNIGKTAHKGILIHSYVQSYLDLFFISCMREM